MVTAIAEASSPTSVAATPKVKSPTPRPAVRHQSAFIRSMPISIVDFESLPGPPTSPLPLPKLAPLPPLPPPSPSSSSPYSSSLPSPPSSLSSPTLASIPTSASRTPPRKVSHDKISSPLGPPPSVSRSSSSSSSAPGTSSLRPPPRPSTQSPGPRPRSIISHLALSSPPSQSLPPVPSILDSNDVLYASSTPTSPTTPTSPISPVHYSTFSAKQHQMQELSSFSTSLPSTTALRPRYGSGRRATNTGDSLNAAEPIVQKARSRSRAPSHSSAVASDAAHVTGQMEEPSKARMTATPVTSQQQLRDGRTVKDISAASSSLSTTPITTGSLSFSSSSSSSSATATAIATGSTSSSTSSSSRRTVEVDLLPRPVGLIATRYYGIESSMRWREGVDPIEKRFASSNGAWRCQDRFAVFFRPGDQIGPDQVVTKTFWSEAWPYPIETILFGTEGPFNSDMSASSQSSSHSAEAPAAMMGNRHHQSEHESERTRATGGQQQMLKSSASFPPLHKSKDPRYITSPGVQKIAKVTIPMPDVAIDQMELVKAPIKVELRIFILESPLRIHATAFLLGRVVTGTTELYA
ncbi:hypothetical protein BGZ94_008977 [Podila epigama]|nr:hypothetical protein BGZ94_008977 [Podila epigama]